MEMWICKYLSDKGLNWCYRCSKCNYFADFSVACKASSSTVVALLKNEIEDVFYWVWYDLLTSEVCRASNWAICFVGWDGCERPGRCCRCAWWKGMFVFADVWFNSQECSLCQWLLCNCVQKWEDRAFLLEHYCLTCTSLFWRPTEKAVQISSISADVHVWWGFFPKKWGVYRAKGSYLSYLPSLWSASLDKCSCALNSLLGRAWDKHHWLLNQRFGIAMTKKACQPTGVFKDKFHFISEC